MVHIQVRSRHNLPQCRAVTRACPWRGDWNASRRLEERGFIHVEQAIVEITLDQPAADAFDAFERRIASDDAVQQCYRVSPGPDFIMHLYARDMPGYLALSQRLFTHDANVRNVKAFFVVKRATFEPRVPLVG